MKKAAKMLTEGLTTDSTADECGGTVKNGIQKIAYSVAEAAEAIGVSKTFLYVHLGENPSFPQIRLGTRIIIPRKRLEEFINNLCSN